VVAAADDFVVEVSRVLLFLVVVLVEPSA